MPKNYYTLSFGIIASKKEMKRVLFLLIATIFLYGELSPNVYKKMQELSPEQLLIEVQRVTKSSCGKGCVKNMIDIKVLKVFKSKCGLVANKRYTLIYKIKQKPAFFIGPQPLKEPKVGKKYRAWLICNQNKSLSLAAKKQSLQELK